MNTYSVHRKMQQRQIEGRGYCSRDADEKEQKHESVNSEDSSGEQIPAAHECIDKGLSEWIGKGLSEWMPRARLGELTRA